MLVVLLLAVSQAFAHSDTPSSGVSSKEKLKALSQRIKQEPGNAQAYVERAQVKKEARDFYGAIRDYSIALTLTNASEDKIPTSQPLVGRGNVFLEIGAYQEALRDFDKVLLEEASMEALYGRAVARYYLDDYFGAIRDLDEVIEAIPLHSSALCNRGIVKLELNKVEEAVTDLSLFLTNYPEHPEAAHALAVATDRLRKQNARR
ncbi:tetratricopeptide repeat protein [Rufibacter glacialis]|uniref:Tetratricopeptide repeat protein n=1 Tax=Rufibacter glacialis TaxID=1259555 RepID=A0A5M8QLY3_9BACT|nr:hypothetical protein [Rufibacter glacialis]KAA6437155.1 hypothetical protein FOE74_01255 [Rufibacter glacialis]